MATTCLCKYSLFWICFIIFIVTVTGATREKTITVKHGILIGTYDNETDVTSFLGVPYAKAPTHHLRFELPQSYYWNGTLNATSFSSICVQDISYLKTWKKYLENQSMSEDCLYLNIYVPGNMTKNTSTQHIMVWIHGGNFVTGSASLFDGTTLSQKWDSILVTVNYRLGPFGFLSTGDEALPGNMGLHDQLMALKWIKENAIAFGGDAQNITLFGTESIYLLSLSNNLTNGLFNRAIVQSSLWRSFPQPWPMFNKLAGSTCPHKHGNKHESHVDVKRKQVMCLKNLTSEYFLNYTLTNPLELFSPTIDNIFLNDSVRLAIPPKDIDFIFGVPQFKESDFEVFPTNTRTGFEDTLGRTFSNLSILAIKSQYLKMDNEMKNVYSNAYNGYLAYTTQTIADKTSKDSPTYVYSYSVQIPDISSESSYGDEFRFLFGSTTTTDEVVIADLMIDAWSHFAQAGVPQLPNNIKWPVYEEENRSYVELRSNITEENVKTRLRESDWIFWNDLIPNLEKLSNPTKPTPGAPMKHTTMGHMEMKSEPIAWGMEDKMVHDLLMGLVIVSVFLFVICVTLIIILYKLRSLKRKNPPCNTVNKPDIKSSVSYSSTAKLNEAFLSESNSAGNIAAQNNPETVTKF
ncbi:carboxylesterase 5A-like isoform X2 [Octopus bimaculoides]|nr:carboxylesterase 5A-like isoform X2 [Octopus bimaculoides]